MSKIYCYIYEPIMQTVFNDQNLENWENYHENRWF